MKDYQVGSSRSQAVSLRDWCEEQGLPHASETSAPSSRLTSCERQLVRHLLYQLHAWSIKKRHERNMFLFDRKTCNNCAGRRTLSSSYIVAHMLSFYVCNWFPATKNCSAASLLLMETALLPFLKGLQLATLFAVRSVACRIHTLRCGVSQVAVARRVTWRRA